MTRFFSAWASVTQQQLVSRDYPDPRYPIVTYRTVTVYNRPIDNQNITHVQSDGKSHFNSLKLGITKGVLFINFVSAQ